MARKESPPPPTTFSFIVGSRYGPRSAEWIVTANGAETYVSTAVAKGAWKATLHASGRWHVKGVKTPTDPPIVKLHRSEFAQGTQPVGLFIAIPDSCLRPASLPGRLPEPTTWLPRPPYGGVTEVAVADWYPREGAMSWPGQEAGTSLIAVCKTSNTRALTLVARQLGPDHPVALSYLFQIEAFQPLPKPITLDSPERRGVVFGKTLAGSILLTELAID